MSLDHFSRLLLKHSSSSRLMGCCTQTAAQLHTLLHYYNPQLWSSHTQFGLSYNKVVLNYLAKPFMLAGYMFSGCWQTAAKRIGLLWCNVLIWSVERSSVTSSSWDWYVDVPVGQHRVSHHVNVSFVVFYLQFSKKNICPAFNLKVHGQTFFIKRIRESSSLCYETFHSPGRTIFSFQLFFCNLWGYIRHHKWSDIEEQ